MVHHRNRKFIFLLERLVAYRTRSNKHCRLAVHNHFRVFATQLECLVFKTLLQQRTAAADGFVLVHIPVFLSNGIEDGFHRTRNAWSEMRHTATEIGNAADRVEWLDIAQITIAALVDVLLVLDAHLTAYYREVEVHRTVGHAAVAHQAVFGYRLGILLQLEVSYRLQHINALHIDYTKFPVHRATVDANTATRAGAEFKHSVSRLLVAVAHSQLAEIDEEHLGEDVHIARERHQAEEGAQSDGVECPARHLKCRVGNAHTRKHIAQSACHKAAVAIERRCGSLR